MALAPGASARRPIAASPARWVTSCKSGTLGPMPTDKPRYQVTDTGEVAALLDLAARRWPATRDRKALLVQLLRAGGAELAAERDAERAAERRREQVAAIASVRAGIDAGALLGDAAWQ